MPASGTASDNGVPVFVDDSGRRLLRARRIIRVGIGMLGGYVVLIVIGLAGSASLPAVHLADLGRLPTRAAASPRLGAGSQQVALPAALEHSGTNGDSASASGKNPADPNSSITLPGQNPGGAQNPGAVPAPGVSLTPGSTTGLSATTTVPGATTPTTQAAPATTTPTVTTPTTLATLPPTTTTAPTPAKGPPTSLPHGPPPGRGHKPS